MKLYLWYKWKTETISKKAISFFKYSISSNYVIAIQTTVKEDWHNVDHMDEFILNCKNKTTTLCWLNIFDIFSHCIKYCYFIAECFKTWIFSCFNIFMLEKSVSKFTIVGTFVEQHWSITVHKTVDKHNLWTLLIFFMFF